MRLNREMRLLGQLASRLPWWTRRGEVIATAALEQLLHVPALSDALLSILTAETGARLPPDLVWVAEAIQEDGARPDLEGRLIEAGRLPTPVVKIEAKLFASLGE